VCPELSETDSSKLPHHQIQPPPREEKTWFNQKMGFSAGGRWTSLAGRTDAHKINAPRQYFLPKLISMDIHQMWTWAPFLQ